MTTYEKCSKDVPAMAKRLIEEIDRHYDLVNVKIDFLFAYPEHDEATGKAKGDAIKVGGYPALGVTRKVSLKDRAKGLGDAEICLDGDWWKDAHTIEKEALLDHELTHIAVTPRKDDLGRPVLKLRKHDIHVGWFSEVAARHGNHSQERMQARVIYDKFGQLLWPDLLAPSTRMQKLETKRV